MKKWFGRWLAPALAAALALGMSLPSRAAGEFDDLRFDDLRVTKYSTPGTYSQVGDTGNFTFDVEYRAGMVSDLEVAIGGGFVFADGSQWYKVGYWDGGGYWSQLQFTVRLKYMGGDSLSVTLRYYDYDLGGYVTQAPQTIVVTETMTPTPTPEPTPKPWESPGFSVSGSMPSLTADRWGEISFQLVNDSLFDAYNVRVVLDDKGQGLFLPTSLASNEFKVGTVSGGSSGYVRFYVNVGPEVEEGYYKVDLKITMTDPNGRTLGDHPVIPMDIYIDNPFKEPEKKPPLLTVTSSALDKNMPGDDGKLELTFKFKNSGEQPASGIRVTLTGFGSGLTLNESMATKTLPGTLAPGAETAITYKLLTSAALVTDIYMLEALIQYEGPDGTETPAPARETLYLNIVRPPDKTEPVRMVSMQQDAQDPGAANTIRVAVSYRNTGTELIRDAVFAFEEQPVFTPMGSFGDRRLGSIEPNQTVPLSVPLYVAASAENGNHRLKALLTYTDARNQKQTVETMISIYIKRPEPSPTPSPTPEPTVKPPDTSVPRVIISQHSLSEATVTAGSPFELRFTLENTSRNKDVKNMKVTVTDEGARVENGGFLPVAGVNSFYVEELRTGQSVELFINLMPKQDAESKSYPVTISLTYEDKDNAQHSVTESLSIPVYQPQRLEITNLFFSGDGMGGAQLNFQFINKGKSPLYNMNIKVEGPMALMEGDYFVGNFMAGGMDFFEDALRMESFGEVSGFLVIQYEDAAGTPLEYRQEISAWIDEGFRNDPGMMDPGFPGIWEDPGMMDPGFPGMDDGEGGGKILGLAPWLFFGLLGFMVLAAGAVVTVIIVRKKRRGRRLEDDDE